MPALAKIAEEHSSMNDIAAHDVVSHKIDGVQLPDPAAQYVLRCGAMLAGFWYAIASEAVFAQSTINFCKDAGHAISAAASQSSDTLPYPTSAESQARPPTARSRFLQASLAVYRGTTSAEQADRRDNVFAKIQAMTRLQSTAR